MRKMTLISLLCLSSLSMAHPVSSPSGNAKSPHFDVVKTQVFKKGTFLVFQMKLSDKAGTELPAATGQLGGSQVYSYVWPTTLDSSVVGFESGQGVLALAATSHPDFDDTPLYDENDDGDVKNDGTLWHTHWVVLTPDDACGPGHLKVKDIPAGTTPRLPATWPGLPILIDSPGYPPLLKNTVVEVQVPLKELGFNTSFQFDGVTAGLQVNASVHSPLLCVTDVFDVASGNLSLPGTVTLP
ncbi:hypothetical protein [Deinococcus roseus]|uniref:Uncharacterized protein n=1 Tax=Deinococcus roseus TaxID=392414 RepID=A0ABQ2D0W3_9DEIO|nr:hypothetical protein [Deinococcus roseus]GGJ40376.1 hypothetical protein GCM10008938_28070 [Deinococcus roseus]